MPRVNKTPAAPKNDAANNPPVAEPKVPPAREPEPLVNPAFAVVMFNPGTKLEWSDGRFMTRWAGAAARLETHPAGLIIPETEGRVKHFVPWHHIQQIMYDERPQ